MEPIQSQLPQTGSQEYASSQSVSAPNNGTINIINGAINDSDISSIIESPGNGLPSAVTTMMGDINETFQSLISIAGDLFGKIPGVPSKPSADSKEHLSCEHEPSIVAPETEADCGCTDVPEYGVPTDTLDIQDYMNQTFTGSGDISEERAMLAVTGWGFNVMNEANPNTDLHSFFNEQKSMLLEQQAVSGKIDYQDVVKTILGEAVRQGLIEDFQADHTFGNAMKVASELMGDSNTIDSGDLGKNKGIGLTMQKLNHLIQNPLENIFRDIEDGNIYKPETAE